MASNQDLKLKSPIVEEYGSTLKEAYYNRMHDKTKHYRALLRMYKKFRESVIAKSYAEAEVHRIVGKLELIHDLFNDSVMIEMKDKLESELVLAEAKVADIKVPNLNCYK